MSEDTPVRARYSGYMYTLAPTTVTVRAPYRKAVVAQSVKL